MNEFELDAIILDVLASYNGLGGTAYGEGFECMHATGTSHRHATGGHNATQTTHDSEGNPATPDPTAASTHSDSGRTDAGTATDFDGVDTGADPNASTDRDNTHGRASSGTDGGTDGRSGGGTDGSNGNGNGGGESPAVQAARERLEREEERNRELAERNIGSSAAQEALERAEENLRRTLQSDAQDQAAGRGYYSERPRSRRDRDDDPGRYTDLDDGEYENDDGSATFVSTDSNGNTHVRVYSIDPQNGGEYLAETRVIRADGSVTVREHDRFGNNVVARRDYGPVAGGAAGGNNEIDQDIALLDALRTRIFADNRLTDAEVAELDQATERVSSKWEARGAADVADFFREEGQKVAAEKSRVDQLNADIEQDVEGLNALRVKLYASGLTAAEIAQLETESNRLATKWREAGQAEVADLFPSALRQDQVSYQYQGLTPKLDYLESQGYDIDGMSNAEVDATFARLQGARDVQLEEASLALVLPEDEGGASAYEAARAWEVGAPGRLHRNQAQLFKAAEDVDIDVDNWDGTLEELYEATVREMDIRYRENEAAYQKDLRAYDQQRFDENPLDGSRPNLVESQALSPAAMTNYWENEAAYQKDLRAYDQQRFDENPLDGSRPNLVESQALSPAAMTNYWENVAAYQSQFLRYTGQEPTGDPARDAEIIAETRDYNHERAMGEAAAALRPYLQERNVAIPAGATAAEIVALATPLIQRDRALEGAEGRAADQRADRRETLSVVAPDGFRQLQTFKASEPFRPETYAEAMETARFNGDTRTQAKLVQYFESYPEHGRYLGRSAANDPLFDATSGEKNAYLGVAKATAAGALAAPFGVRDLVWGAGGAAGAAALSTILPTGPNPGFSLPWLGPLYGTGEEGFGQLTGEDLNRLPSALAEGYLFGRLGGKGQQVVSQAGTRYLPAALASRVTTLPGRVGTGALGSGLGDTPYFGLVEGLGFTPNELRQIGAGVALSPVLDVAGGVALPYAGALGAVATREVYGPSAVTKRPYRFPAELFVNPAKPREVRIAEAEAYMDGFMADLQARHPEHYASIMRTTGGRNPTLAEMRLDDGIDKGIDVAEMLRAREFLSRANLSREGGSYAIPESDLALTVRPTPFLRQRPPGAATHATSDVTPHAAGGPVTELPGKGIANRGVFFAPGYGITDTLARPYDTRYIKGPQDTYPGLIERDLSQSMLVPKMSIQGNPGDIDLDTLTRLPRQGRTLPAESAPTPGKRHRATIILDDPEGRIMLVKGKGDDLWGLPGGGVDRGETALLAGPREALEETGYTPSNVSQIFDLEAPTTHHSVLKGNVADPSAAAQLQAKEIEDFMWWDGATPVDMMPSTRDILETYTGKRPTGIPDRDSRIIGYEQAQDWRQRENPTAEIELLDPIGFNRPPLDPRSSVAIWGHGDVGARYYLEEGAPPVTRAQIARAAFDHLRESVSLLPESGLTIGQKQAGAVDDVATWVASQRQLLHDRAAGGDIAAVSVLQELAALRSGGASDNVVNALLLQRVRTLAAQGDPTAQAALQRLGGSQSAALEGMGRTPTTPTPGRGATGPAAEVVAPRSARVNLESPDINTPRAGLEPPDIEPGRSTLEQPDIEPGRSTLEPPDIEPGRSTLEPPDIEPGRSTLEPPDDEPGRSTLEPPDDEPGRSTLEPPDDEPGRSTLEPPDDEPGRSTLEPPDDEPGRSTLEPPDDEPGRPTLEPPDDEPGRPTLEPPELDPPRLEPPELDPPRLDPPRLEPPELEPPRLEPPPPESPPGRRRIRRPEDEDKEEVGTQQPGAHPRTAVFTTTEKVEVDLLTGEEIRTPVGNLPAETLKVTEWQATPIPDQHLAGRVVDVKTDGAGRPVVQQRDTVKHTRPQGEGAGTSEAWPDAPPANWPQSSAWPPQTQIKRQLARSLMQSQTEAVAGATTSGGGKSRSGKRSYKPSMSKVLKAATKGGQGKGDLLTQVGRRRHGWL